MVQWVEQKAIIIFLTLLHLGIKKINLGPNLPAFVTPNLAKFLVDNFELTGWANNPFYTKPRPITNAVTVKAPQPDKAPVKEFSTVQPYKPYKLVKKQDLGNNTRIFTFEFSNPNSTYELTPGKFVLIRMQDADGNYYSKAYTPVTKQGTPGQFEVLIKVYQYGRITNYLDNVKIGNYVEMQGDGGEVEYKGNGHFVHIGETLKSTKVNMISGGVGISPMVQILEEIGANKNDKTKVSLVSYSVNDSDILFQNEINDFVKNRNGQIQAAFLTQQRDGFVNEKIIREKFFAPGPDVVNMICGPQKMRKNVVDILKKVGYDEKSNIIFY